jgi:16S rRNA (guanine527-N7)-methyltransferase
VGAPDAEEGRWPAERLKELGLEPHLTITDPFHFTVLRQREICPDRYPRRTGIPAKRPLF